MAENTIYITRKKDEVLLLDEARKPIATAKTNLTMFQKIAMVATPYAVLLALFLRNSLSVYAATIGGLATSNLMMTIQRASRFSSGKLLVMDPSDVILGTLKISTGVSGAAKSVEILSSNSEVIGRVTLLKKDEYNLTDMDDKSIGKYIIVRKQKGDKDSHEILTLDPNVNRKLTVLILAFCIATSIT